jgi:hypothetical protein
MSVSKFYLVSYSLLALVVLMAQSGAEASEVTLKFGRDLSIRCCPYDKCSLVSLQFNLFKTLENQTPVSIETSADGLRKTVRNLRQESVIFGNLAGPRPFRPIGKSLSFESRNTELLIQRDVQGELRSLEFAFTTDEAVTVRLSSRFIPEGLSSLGESGPVKTFTFDAAVNNLSYFQNIVASLPAVPPIGSTPYKSDLLGQFDSTWKCQVRLPAELIGL